LNCKFISWQCTSCGQYQSREVRLTTEKSLGEKFKKVNLKCLFCNKRTKLKLTNQFGLNVHAEIFDDARSCMEHIKTKNRTRDTQDI